MEGWQFAAELSQLRIVGRVDLPALSSTFAAMNRAVDSTAGGETSAFQAPGGGSAASHAVWTALRDDFQNVLGNTATNILDAGVTIEHIVDAYLTTDEAARTSLEAAWANGQTPNLQEAEEKFAQNTPPTVVIKDDGV
ncbi:hypothetical protein AB0C12_43010 [Actinoplanes sp. NPDC048967]|uniref:hypothetical protein n=1 Tax=Actinoplanes sp. NPDC048967 TaxID=3155269 RepID=UPI0033ECF4D9